MLLSLAHRFIWIFSLVMISRYLDLPFYVWSVLVLLAVLGHHFFSMRGARALLAARKKAIQELRSGKKDD